MTSSYYTRRWLPYRSSYYNRLFDYYPYYSSYYPYRNYYRYYSSSYPYRNYYRYYSSSYPYRNYYRYYSSSYPYRSWYKPYSTYLYDRYPSYRQFNRLYDHYYNPYYYRDYYSRPFEKTYSELKNKMYMFKNFLDAMPKSRSDVVNDLEIPDDVLKSHVYPDPEELLAVRTESPLSIRSDSTECELRGGVDTSSSVSLSRALTDSEIDYDRNRRLKNRSADPFDDLKNAMGRFPLGYRTSLESFKRPLATESPPPRGRPYYNESLHRHMTRFFDEDCCVFAPDDPALVELEETLMDLKSLENDLDC